MLVYGEISHTLNIPFNVSKEGLIIKKDNKSILIPFYLIDTYSINLNTITAKKWYLLKHRLISLSLDL